MGLIELILLLAVAGFLTYLIITYIPMPAPFKNVIVAVIVIVLVLFLVRTFIGDIPVGRLR